MDAFVSLPLVGIDDKAVSITASKNSHYFDGVETLNSADAAKYPTANAVVGIRRYKAAVEEIHKYYTTLSVSAVSAAINSAIAGAVTKGQVVLVAGVLAITIPGLTTSNLGFPSLVAQGGTSTGVYEYKGVCTANTLTISAVTVTGSVVTGDTSTVNYFVL